jgi:hypothetical protein
MTPDGGVRSRGRISRPGSIYSRSIIGLVVFVLRSHIAADRAIANYLNKSAFCVIGIRNCFLSFSGHGRREKDDRCKRDSHFHPQVDWCAGCSSFREQSISIFSSLWMYAVASGVQTATGMDGVFRAISLDLRGRFCSGLKFTRVLGARLSLGVLV